MVKVGLIGYGAWGKVLHDKLKNFCDVKFLCRSSFNYSEKLDQVDWVVISTPNETHFEIVMKCIMSRTNVFCEKPLTLTKDESIQLYCMASLMKVKLYVDDVQNWRDINFDFYGDKPNYVERKKKDHFNHEYYGTKDLLYRLAYHDIYHLYFFLKKLDIEDVIPIDIESKLHFVVLFKNGNTLAFLYDTNFDGDRTHNINGTSMLATGKDDPLYDMLHAVLNEDVDFDNNQKISVFANDFIDKIEKKLYKKVAVIGGGIFGCTTAIAISNKGHKVDLFEKNDDILSKASGINQYRIHRGYHYPRSKETAQSSIKGEDSFLQTYGKSVMNEYIKHYYCIAKEDSLVTAEQYKTFLDEINLDYKEKKLDLIHKSVVDLTIEADEFLFNPVILKKLCWVNLRKSGVNVNLKKEFEILNLGDYDYVINATYSNLNQLTPKDKQKDYQFELCEKPVVKLPEQYKNKSVVIMDGPFMCIDPYGDTGWHVMGNVVHAIHSTNVGKFPEYDSKFDELLNKGIVKNPPITNIDKFIESAKRFFIDIDKAEHIGSMFTFRTVLPNREKDDARPTLVEKIGDGVYNIFSGKIGTCIEASNEVLNEIK